MDSNGIFMKIKEDVVPSLFSAGASLILYNFVFGQSVTDSIPFAGRLVPAWAVVGGSVFASQLAGNVLENNVLTMIPDNSYAQLEGMLVKPALAGLAFYGISYLAISNETSFIDTFGIGVGSVLAGEYVSKAVGY